MAPTKGASTKQLEKDVDNLKKDVEKVGGIEKNIDTILKSLEKIQKTLDGVTGRLTTLEDKNREKEVKDEEAGSETGGITVTELSKTVNELQAWKEEQEQERHRDSRPSASETTIDVLDGKVQALEGWKAMQQEREKKDSADDDPERNTLNETITKLEEDVKELRGWRATEEKKSRETLTSDHPVVTELRGGFDEINKWWQKAKVDCGFLVAERDEDIRSPHVARSEFEALQRTVTQVRQDIEKKEHGAGNRTEAKKGPVAGGDDGDEKGRVQEARPSGAMPSGIGKTKANASNELGGAYVFEVPDSTEGEQSRAFPGGRRGHAEGAWRPVASRGNSLPHYPDWG